MNLEVIKKNEVKTILQFAVPSIIAMVLTAMITIADGFFIGNYVGKEGLAAVNLGLPILYLFLAIGLMISVGGVAIAGMALGSKDLKKANSVFNQTIITSIVASVVFAVVVLIFFNPIMNLLHAEGKVAQYFVEYYLILLIELPVLVINSSFGMFIRGGGNPQFYMKINVMTVLVNIVLDYFFSVWLNLGVQGIAWSSVIAALLALLWSIYYFMNKSPIYKFGRFLFSKDILKNTLFNGSSEFIGELSMCIAMFAYNWVILKHIGVEGLAAFSIVGYISYIFSMVIIGFGQGASPLLSFTFGAEELVLCRDIRKKTNLFVFFAGVIAIVIMLITSDWYSCIIIKEPIVRDLVGSGIRIFVFSFLFSGVNTIASFYFTSIGKAKESAIISSSRGLVVLLICIFTLPILFGMTGVWLVSLVTEMITLVLSITFLYRSDHMIKKTPAKLAEA